MKQDNIMKAIEDRLSSPISGTFLLFWMFENWNVFLWLISKESVQAKIKALNDLLTLKSSFVVPALMTIGYLLAMPFLKSAYSRYVEMFNFKIEREKLKNSIELRQIENLGSDAISYCNSLIEELNILRNSDLKSILDYTNSAKSSLRDLEHLIKMLDGAKNSTESLMTKISNIVFHNQNYVLNLKTNNVEQASERLHFLTNIFEKQRKNLRDS